ncbi:MAG: hypothetical protein AAF564_11715 [Bacteroidota bacterium]
MSAYHYIITVHGMGESRYGETTLPVISRCAEVVNDVLTPKAQTSKDRRASFKKKGRDFVTLGAYVGASPLENNARPWVEFEGIPTEAAPRKTFTGIATHDPDGKLIRFAEIWWKDLVDVNEHVLEPASPWADGLIGRIERMNTQPPTWMPQLLFKLQDVLGPLQTILGSRVPDVEDLAFNKYLGDVQIYAEYEPMRGTAVRRFHERMNQLCSAHYDAFTHLPEAERPKPHFTIIAHSLGSIMSLDALMYAHRASGTTTDTANFPFPGYAAVDAEAPANNWINYVDTFVTLGSPIDKFLLFWPYRYQYLNDEAWIDPALRNKRRIRHINYCDEQDPVGQSLDTLRSTRAYAQLFTATFDEHKPASDDHTPTATRVVQRVTNQVTKTIQNIIKRTGINREGDKNNEFDVVYRRSIWPGLAHTSYWKDKDLFKNILEHVLKNKAGSRSNPNVVRDKKGMYILITLLTYFIVPFLIVALDTMTYDSFLEPESWKGYLAVGALFVCACWISREVVNLLVWWRQLLRNKRSREVVPQTVTSIFVKWIVRLGMPLVALGFAQVAIDNSGTYVNEVKTLQTVPAPTNTPVDGTAAETLWPATPDFLEPFLLINGKTHDVFAFWLCLLGLLMALTAYRMNASNFKESARYESYLSIPVDIIVLLSGYWLLLTLWQGNENLQIFAGNIWTHPLGLTSLAALAGWHLFTVVRNLTVKNKKQFLQITQEIVVSFIVLGVGWLLVTQLTTFIGDFFPSRLSPDARMRTAFFCVIGFVVWIYMAMRFYVAKVQLGADKVPRFASYYGKYDT